MAFVFIENVQKKSHFSIPKNADYGDPTRHVASRQVPGHHKGLVSFQSGQKSMLISLIQHEAAVLMIIMMIKGAG